ncbi:MAG: S-layer homology domain-containing protein [Clostridia bacterium]|nr:S-layer homology domain-containing protein [Clostridia bacterium]
MKKLFEKALCVIVTAFLICSGTYARGEDGMSVEWYGDYKNMELVICVKPSVDYIQQITAVMYPASVQNPGIDDYCRMAEISVGTEEKGEIRFKISDALDASDGAYKLIIQGSGYLADISRAEESVWLLKPSDIDDGSGNGLLKDINTASADTVKQSIDKAAEALQISVSDEESRTKLNAFINIRNTDFNNNFKTMEDVRVAWEASGIIEYLSQGNADASVLESKFEKLADAFEIDISDKDYIAYREDIYKSIISVNASFNNGSGVYSCGDIRKAFKEAKGIAVINNSSSDNIEGNIALYYKDLGISEETYLKFINMSYTNKQKVIRQLLRKNFTKAADAEAAFTDAICEIGKDSGGDSGGSSGNHSGGGSGGSAGKGAGSGYTASVYPQAETQQAKTGFADCGTQHWAYPYVDSLKDSGIISGYSDGSFYPDKPVKREEFVKMTVMAAGLYSEGYTCDFDDVLTGEWYFSFIAAAKHWEIINGIGERIFGVGQYISREDVAVIVCRILNVSGADVTAGHEVKTFSDRSDMSGYAVQNIEELSGMNILNGFEDGSFRPKDSLTRAEAAKIICRFMEYIQK